MDLSLFEQSCFESTLRTLKLRPTEILDDPQRLPENENDPLLQIARPTWIGRNYEFGRILLLGKNPAGGSQVHKHMSHPSDHSLAFALDRLIKNQDIESYRSWRDEAQLTAMRTWRFWDTSVKAVLAELEPLRVDEQSIALGNLMPFRSKENKVYHREFVRAWDVDLSHVIGLLKPRLIVKMTAEFNKFDQFCGEFPILQFRRSNGDRGITPFGHADLKAIRRWAIENSTV